MKTKSIFHKTKKQKVGEKKGT